MTRPCTPGTAAHTAGPRGSGHARTSLPSHSHGRGIPAEIKRRDDTSLVEAAGRGDDAAFAVLVERHAAALHRVALRLLGDRAEAEDVVQDTFVRLWQHAGHWQPSGAGLVGWLHRVTVNRCLDRQRRLRPQTMALVPDRADPTPRADRQLGWAEAESGVADVMSQLPERYRTALMLCYFNEISNQRAAAMLDLNIKAMESLLLRARRRMRDLLVARDLGCADVTREAANSVPGPPDLLDWAA